MRLLHFLLLSFILINVKLESTEFTFYYQDFETYWEGWTYVDGNSDGFYWQVGSTGDLGDYTPPSYGTRYAFYSDNKAGNGVINTNEEWISPVIYIGNIDSLTLEYSYGFKVHETGEHFYVEVRFFTQVGWGGWQTIKFYSSSLSGIEICELDNYLPADSVQIRWVYNDEESQSHWGWACAVDNVKLIGFKNSVKKKIFLWDNDGGITFLDDEFGIHVGFEEYIRNALLNNLDTILDTLIVEEVLPPIEEILNYNALFVVNGAREGLIIDSTDLQKIEQFFGAGGNVYMEGNNIVEFLNNYYPPLLDSFRVAYGGNTYSSIFQVQGVEGTFTEGEIFSYFSGLPLLTSLDILVPVGTGENVLQSNEGKAYVCRGVGYSYSAEKSKSGSPKKSFISSLSLSALKKFEPLDISQDLRDEFLKKILGFMGLGKILVVDYASFEKNNIILDLEALGYYNYDLIQYGPSFSDMKPYSLIFWRTGRYGIPLSEQDTMNIEEYIDYGGRVILTGENLASSIGIGGYQEECEFLLNYFGVDYLYDSVYAIGVMGLRNYDGYNGLYDGVKPDRITGPDTCFLYRDSKSNEGAGFGNIFGKTKTLFLGFSYDCLTNPNERMNILLRTFKLFGINKVSEPPVGIDEEKDANRKYLLITDYKELEKYLPLYDISGRKITKPEKSGVYINKDEKGIKKILFIK